MQKKIEKTFFNGSVLGTVLLSALGLLSYLPGFSVIGSVHPGYIPMAPSTSFSFILFAVVLWIYTKNNTKILRAFSLSITILVTLFGLLELIGFYFEMDLNFENEIIPDMGLLNGVPIARMSPSTGILFFFSGLALICLFNNNGVQKLKKSYWGQLAGIFSSIVLISAATFFLGYLYGTPLLYDLKTIPMAFTTAVGFGFLGVGITIAAGNEYFPFNLFSGKSTRAQLMRAFLPLISCAILVQGLFLSSFPFFKIANDAFSAAFFAISYAFLTGLVINKVSKILSKRIDQVEMVRKQAEAELRKSEERFRAVAINTPDHILVQDLKLRYEWVLNPQLGLSEKDMIGKTDFEFLKKEDAENLTKLKKGVINSGNPKFVKVPLISSSGETQFFEGSYTPRHDRKGKVNGLIGYFRNETEKIKSEEALRKSEEKWQLIIETSPVGICSVDLLGNFITTNLAYEQMVGYSKEELSGLSFFDVTHPDNRPKNKKLFQEMFSLKTTSFFMEKRYVHKNGAMIEVAVHATGIRDAEGNVRFGTAFVSDITDRKKMEIQLQQAQKMESVGQLASGVAHEINNPINGIMNYAQLIQDKIGEENSLSEYTSEIIHETKRVSKIVKNLLVFARQEKESHSPARIKDIVYDTMSLIQTVLKRDQITLIADISKDLPKIKCRSQQIQQVVMNLIVNARDSLNEKYSGFDDNKKIEIISGFFEKGGRRWIRTTVEDRGLGIAQDTMERMFDPFYTTKERAKGTGLGLSISYGIVKDHHGELSVESEPGLYTRFHMDLPVDNGWGL